MGAWGAGIFDNDDAADWVGELAVARNLQVVREALQKADTTRYLEAPECCAALGAAEVVAALKGHPLPTLPTEAASWVRSHRLSVDDDLLRLARMAIHRIERASELRELWEESSELDVWVATIRDLEARLSAV